MHSTRADRGSNRAFMCARLIARYDYLRYYCNVRYHDTTRYILPIHYRYRICFAPSGEGRGVVRHQDMCPQVERDS